MTVAFLLVTCCLEQTRAEVLAQVLRNLSEEAPELHETLTVFDNASTFPGVANALRDRYSHVYQADKNIGYWSAIDWWLHHLASDPPQFTYIIESDMIHYNFNKLWVAARYLTEHPDVGSCRTHEYSIVNKHLYNKDAPLLDSKRNLWHSHTNRMTGKQVIFSQAQDDIWNTTFLTQLPALNRYQAMFDVFRELEKKPRFIEVEFQAMYWEHYKRTSIIDGGIFHCDLNPYTAGPVTGSWTSPHQLRELGYHPTRNASIVPRDQYTVRRL